MAMFRSAVGIALRRTQPASRLFSSVARGSSACSGAARGPSPISRFPVYSDATRRMVSSYGRGGNEGGKSSKAFWNQDSTWKVSDFLFFGITGVGLFAFQNNIRDSQERKWQRQIRDIEMRTYMMDKEKGDELNTSSFH